MIFQSLQIILPISGSNFCFKQKTVHVAHCNWPVPLWSDRGCESSDLMRSGRSRSGYTGSVSDLICIARSTSHGRKRGRGSPQGGLGFRWLLLGDGARKEAAGM
jgi:hypothetical protein